MTVSATPETSFSNNIQPHDVLFGRGGGTNQHIGNQHFRELVAQQMPAYLRAAKKDKVKIARHIVSIIQSQGGRFLKRRSDATTPTTVDSASSSGEDGYWIPVTDQRAREKTSQALREGLDVRHRTFRTDHKGRVMMARRSLLKQQKQKEMRGDKMVGDDAASVCSSPLSLATTTKEETHHDDNHDTTNDNPRTRPRLVKGIVLQPTDDVVHHVRRYDPYVSDDVGASSASTGGVPDLLEEDPYEQQQQQQQQQHQEQFDDAPEEYSSTMSTSHSGGGDHHHQHRQHLERLWIQFEPPRTIAATTTTTTTAISSRNKVVVPYCV